MSRIEKASNFAAEKHKNQWRDTIDTGRDHPYIEHPKEVAAFVREAGCDDEAVCVAWLHDVIEDCGCTHGELVGLFGDRIAYAVLELTDDPRLSKIERKAAQIGHARLMSFTARCVKIADKVSNVRSLPTSGWDLNAIRAYVEHASKVCAKCASGQVPIEPKKHAQMSALVELSDREFFAVRQWMNAQAVVAW